MKWVCVVFTLRLPCQASCHCPSPSQSWPARGGSATATLSLKLNPLLDNRTEPLDLFQRISGMETEANPLGPDWYGWRNDGPHHVSPELAEGR